MSVPVHATQNHYCGDHSASLTKMKVGNDKRQKILDTSPSRVTVLFCEHNHSSFLWNAFGFQIKEAAGKKSIEATKEE